jgi:hypothetical protein
MITNTSSYTRTRWNASLNADDHEHDVLHKRPHPLERELERR